MKRRMLFLAGALLAVAALVPSLVWGDSSSISGTIGETVDSDATTGFYLRYVGNPAPSGYSHAYQWGEPAILTESPEAGPVIFSGTIDVADRVANAVGGIGLLDPDGLAAGSTGFFSGAHVYLNVRPNGDLRVGVSDGNSGGEIVQNFITIPAADIPNTLSIIFTVDGTADPATCAGDVADLPTADGCMTLEITEFNAIIMDSYGSLIIAGGNPVEFTDGGVPGWEAFIDGSADQNTGFDYSLTVEPTVVNDPESIGDCQDSGWEEYGFANQGLCVRFVNTGVDSRA